MLWKKKKKKKKAIDGDQERDCESSALIATSISQKVHTMSTGVSTTTSE